MTFSSLIVVCNFAQLWQVLGGFYLTGQYSRNAEGQPRLAGSSRQHFIFSDIPLDLLSLDRLNNFSHYILITKKKKTHKIKTPMI